MDEAAARGSGSAGVLVDQIGIGVLTRLVPRELVDEVIAAAGRREKRVRLLPARVVVYFVMAMTLFHADAYEEVIRKLVQGLRGLRIWRNEWVVPSSGALTQARRRLGAEVMRDLFFRVAVPCARRSTQGAWLGRWRLMALDGFDIEVPDSAANAERFGYAGKKKDEKGVFPKVLVVGLAECGTHAIVGAEFGAQHDTEIALATRLLGSGIVAEDMLVIGDRGMYSNEHLQRIRDAGADALLRAKINVLLPVIKWLPDGSYLSYSANRRARTAASKRLAAGTMELTELPGLYVRVVEYEVTNRGEDELFTLVTTILDPLDAPATELAAAYHERWEIEAAIGEMKTHQKGAGALLRSKSPEMVEQELWGMLLTYYGVRHLMAEAADQAELDPDRLSFIRSLRIVRRQVGGPADFSPTAP
ncbi:IS4 family transposase [Actinomadura sp. NAK00032]|uniref:IS4 family transposase n=1 Tax=Actinomadura sp. NAK00032 TaxID=2742128 RepID=UPI001591A749|nr:IS4 family transposase [Actinomadura sp. NAK00032]QKW39024.1 IS4 family transposase [Actinomadura sp. NAK00032]